MQTAGPPARSVRLQATNSPGQGEWTSSSSELTHRALGRLLADLHLAWLRAWPRSHADRLSPPTAPSAAVALYQSTHTALPACVCVTAQQGACGGAGGLWCAIRLEFQFCPLLSDVSSPPDTSASSSLETCPLPWACGVELFKGLERRAEHPEAPREGSCSHHHHS